MNPTPPDANSPLATLRQLKEMLDAGTITPQEFSALKQQLIPSLGSLPTAGVAEGPAAPASPHIEPMEVSYAPPATPAPLAAPPPLAPPAAPAASYPSPYLDTPGALTPEATPLLAPEPDWDTAPDFVSNENQFAAASPADAAERRNPLNLIFAIGGLLLFLAVVGYLASNRSSAPDEHLTSTSQTAADSTAAAPEVGPQAEQLTLPPAAAPETIRVAPAAAPVPVVTPSSADSSATPTTAPAATPVSVPAAAMPKAATPKSTVTKPATASAPADTAANRP